MGVRKEAFLVFILFLLILSFFQFRTSSIIGYDGGIHIRMAQIIREKGFIRQFPWITESILSRNYADTQIGFRILLIPFTFFNLSLGAKIAAILFSSVFFAFFYWFLSKTNKRHALFWTALLFVGSAELIYRFLFTRPMAISLAFLFLTVYLLFKQRYVWLIPVSFFYVWFYQGFIFQLVLVSVYFLIESIYLKKVNLKVMAYPLIGVILGLVLNPYFYSNIGMLYLQLFKVNLGGNLFNEEWRAWALKDFILNNVIYLSCLLLGIILIFKSKKLTKKNLFLLLVALIFLVFAIKHRRMIEYFAPFSILFAALSLDSYLRVFNLNFKKTKALMVVLILFLLITNSVILIKLIPERDFLYRYENCASWLKENAPDSSLVFINGYAFDYLFLKNPNLRYTHGIDGAYSYLYDEGRFNKYIDLLQGKPLARDIIKEDFKADYVFTGKIKADQNLNNFLIKNKENYEVGYEDEDCAVLRVR